MADATRLLQAESGPLLPADISDDNTRRIIRELPEPLKARLEECAEESLQVRSAGVLWSGSSTGSTPRSTSSRLLRISGDL